MVPATAWRAATRARGTEGGPIMARNVIRFDPFAELNALQRQLFPEGLFSQSRRTAPTTHN